MIKMKNRALKIKGEGPELTAEFSMIVRGMKNALKMNGMPEEAAKVLLDKAYEAAFMSDEELAAAFDQLEEDLAEKLAEVERGEA